MKWRIWRLAGYEEAGNENGGSGSARRGGASVKVMLMACQ